MKEIRRIIKEFDSIDHANEQVALASVVNVEESSYRRIGARMLVRSNGLWVGGISGGCLEGDALRRSQMAIFKGSASRVVYDTMDDDDNQIGVGLGCNGRIEVLFNPIDPGDDANDIEQLRSIVNKEEPSILLKIIESGHRDDLLGKSKVVYPGDQSDFLSIPFGLLSPVIERAIEKKKSQIGNVQVDGDEMIKILVEFIRPETKLVIAGDNYDVNAFAGIADELGWDLHVIGKKSKLSKQIFEKANSICEFHEAPSIRINPYTAVVLMTHDYNKDHALLKHFLTAHPAYLGILGPKKRMQKLLKDLDLPESNLPSFIHAPVGLDIGAESPEEIALSIASEIVSFFRNREGTSLKFREGTIHERN